MNEIEGISPREATLLQYWRILRKRQMTAIAFAAILLVTVSIGTLLATPYYGATAVLEISSKAPTVLDVEEVNEVVSFGNSNDDRRSYYATQYRILESRTLIAETIRRLREEHGITDFDEMKDPVGAFRSALEIDPQMDTRLVHITIEFPDPDKASLFANVLAETYMEMNLQRSLQASEAALSWLQEQQEVYRQRKYNSETTLHTFKYDQSLEQRASTEQKLHELEGAWSQQHTARVQLQATYERLIQQARGAEWLAVANHLATENPVLEALLQAHQKKQQERSSLATRYLDGMPEMVRLAEELTSLEAQIRQQTSEILAGKKAELQTVADREEALASEMEAVQTELREFEQRAIEYEFLQADAAKNESLFHNIDVRLAEVDLSKVIQSNNIWFIDRAEPNDRVVRPKLTTNLPVALLLGILGGVALAFFMEYVDSTIKSREDLEDIIGVPFLGAVPLISPAALREIEDDRDRAIFVNARPRSSVAENLRSVRTNILFRLPDVPQKRMLITSAAPKEGKSYVSSNLAAIIAMTGSRVLLIDADLRRPTQHTIFGMENDVGLSTALLGDLPVGECIQPTHVKGLDLMSSGPRPANPAELLGGDNMRRLFDQLSQYDFIIADSSPVGAVADPLILSRVVHGVLMVVESDKTGRDQVMQTQFRLAEMGANILGAIVNKLDVKKSGYGYYYYYDYNAVYYETEADLELRTG